MKIGFISDIHEDVHSLEKALRLLSKENCNKIFCLGDIVGFTLPFYRYIETRDAEECVRLIKENCDVVVAGNHDLFAVRKVPEYKAGFDFSDDWYSLDYDIRAKKARNKIWLYEDNEIRSTLSDSAKEYLNGLREVEVVQNDGIKLLISHFCFPDFSGSAIYFPSETFHLQKHFDYMKNNHCSTSISGHGHPEGIIIVDEDRFSSMKFGQHILSDNTQWIVIPCIARTTRSNGVAILDTSSMQFYTIPLASFNY